MKRSNFNIGLIFIVALILTLNIVFISDQTPSSAQVSSDKPISKKCKCLVGKKWNGKKCIRKTGDEVCITLFDPVCGCDGMTYSNNCVANLNGIKKFTQGECNSSDESKSLPIKIE